LPVRRRFAFCPGLDQARLELADEGGVLGQRFCELRLRPSLGCRSFGELLQLVRQALDFLIRGRHFFVGGSSPVNVRHTFAAPRRETTVATAPKPP